jgi:hypothetical protein
VEEHLALAETLTFGGRDSPRRRRQYVPAVAWFSKRVNSPKNVRRTVPVGPLRCLLMMISAVPLSFESAL